MAQRPFPVLPTGQWLLLSAAVMRAAAAAKKSALSDVVLQPFLSGLCEGDIGAIGDIVNGHGQHIANGLDTAIKPEEWSGLPYDNFRNAWSQNVGPILRPHRRQNMELHAVNVRIKTTELDAWLNPPPASASKINAETECEEWLREIIEPGRAKQSYRDEAKLKFQGLSVRGFDRAWARVAGDKPEITTPGRPKKKSSQ